MLGFGKCYYFNLLVYLKINPWFFFYCIYKHIHIYKYIIYKLMLNKDNNLIILFCFIAFCFSHFTTL